jgi:hypothetical protein
MRVNGVAVRLPAIDESKRLAMLAQIRRPFSVRDHSRQLSCTALVATNRSLRQLACPPRGVAPQVFDGAQF